MIKTIIKDRSIFVFFNKKYENKYKIESNLELNQNLEMVDKKKVIGVISKNYFLYYEIFNNLFFIYIKIKDKKKIILEINSEEFNFLELKKIVELYNFNNSIKEPLGLDFHDRERISILSLSTNQSDWRGFFRLFILLMFYNYFRMIIDNFMENKFIFLENLKFLALQIQSYSLFLQIFILLFWVFSNFYIQNNSFKRNDRKLANNYIIISSITIFIFKPIMLNYFNFPFYLSVMFLSSFVVLLLKLISYCHVLNNIFQKLKILKKGNKEEIDILKKKVNEINFEILNKNLNNFYDFWTLKKFLYFLLIPTLCFQLEYSKTNKIRKFWLAKKILELFILILLNIFFFFQWLLPILEKLGKEIMINENKDYLKIFSLFLRISTPNTIIWLNIFYSTFHVYLNIFAEILYFADRSFYFEWWNCKSLDEYWKLWNLPIHYWFLRHVYYPLKSYKISKASSSFIIFLISAFFHEYILSGALFKIYYYFFFGMLLQYFVIIFEEFFQKIFKLKNSNFGNYSFWISFCFIGQPFMISLYYIEHTYNIN